MPFGLLVIGVVVPNVEDHPRAEGNFAACQYELRTVDRGLKAYAKDHDGHYPASLSKLTPTYLKTLPGSTADGSNYSSGPFPLCYTSHLHPDRYTACCSGYRFGVLGVPPGYPQFSSTVGLIKR